MPDKNKKLINDMYRMERDNMQESIRAQNRQNSKELEESARMRQESLQKEIVKGSNSKNPINMGSPLYGKISSACKAAAKKKFKVWPSAYASGWGVRCTKAGGPGKFGGKKKK